jgi:rhamnose utilization protein RhaD (predicted bifunctional aldolase and dehydrogenase)
LKNLWDDKKANALVSDLDMRVYTSNLLGESDELVLHGGGNTSVKSLVDSHEILFVKGSGWDLVSIEAKGFAPVKMDALLDMAKFKSLSDSEMVRGQKEAMTDKEAPNPSVEAILHALIPFKFVDHTHADSVVTISNSKNGKKYIAEIFPNFLIIPYVMPGFILAKKIYDMTIDFDWDNCEGIILHNHGIFTFDDDAKKSYTKMIDAVSKAEDFLDKFASIKFKDLKPSTTLDLELLKELIEIEKNHEVVMRVDQSPLALTYVSTPNLPTVSTRGVLTPEHIIRTKREPLVLENEDIKEALEDYIDRYNSYFNSFSSSQIALNPAPNYVVAKGFGLIYLGKTQKEVDIIADVIEHTMMAVLRADKLGGYESISLKDSFDMEYWELEQAKLKKSAI